MGRRGTGTRKKKRSEGGKKGIEKERKEGRRNKQKERRTEKKKEFRGKGGKKINKEKKKSSAGFKPVRLVLLVFLSVEWRGWLEGLVSLFSIPEPHSSLLFSLQSSSSGSFCSPLGL